jgi:tRNA-dihydrouridine synthase B
MSALLDKLKQNPFVLAPMAGITDSAFRSFMREMGAGIVVTELVSAHGIEYRGEQTLRLMKFTEGQRPIGIQLFGETAEAIANAAKYSEGEGADFIDLNCGCPVPKVVKKGAGSALLKDLPQLKLVLRAMKAAVKVPVTLKIRTGWDESTRNAVEVAQLAYDCGIEWLAIHGRTRAQGYSGRADWDFIGEVKAKSKIPIIGNGDIHSGAQAVERLTTYGLDGVMIGRGCLKNPWIFQDALRIFKDEKLQHIGGEKPADRDFLKALALLRFFLESNCDERLTGLQMKKFAAWFSAGYPNAKKFRHELFIHDQSLDQLSSTITRYFDEVRVGDQLDTSQEDFLMGGHG